MSARDEILARVRAALGPTPPQPAPIPRDYLRSSTMEDPVALLTDRLLDYGATVVPTTAGGVADAIAAQIRGRVRVAPGLPWTVPGAAVDDACPAAELDLVDTAVTACAAACAQTGTIVLDASPDQGRRALSLVPDRHVCVVRSAQIAGTVPELLARLDPRRPTTFISGPSATSDIELRRVSGVHGPRELVVILVTDIEEG